MASLRKTNLEMRTLLLCRDAQFTGITRSVLNQLRVTPEVIGCAEAALGIIQGKRV